MRPKTPWWLWVVVVVVLCPPHVRSFRGSGDGFGAPTQGQTIRIGGLAIRGFADFMTRFSPTFATYLNETVGARYNITFEAVPMNFEDTFDFVENRKIDFIYTNPSAFSCVESEFGVAPIVSLRNFRLGHTLNQFGGTIFTRAERGDINSIYDLKDKIVEAVSITGLGACQMQWRLMTEKGMNFLMDPAQIIFAFNQKTIVKDVLSGRADVGFVRTDLAEGLQAQGKIDLADIKVAPATRWVGRASVQPGALLAPPSRPTVTFCAVLAFPTATGCGRGGLARGRGAGWFAVGGAYWPLATVHSDPLWVPHPLTGPLPQHPQMCPRGCISGLDG